VTDSQGGHRLTNAVNEVAVIGNLTRDADLRFTPGGDAVCTVSIAVNDGYKDKTGNWQEKTHFVEINLWRDLADEAGNLEKGDPIFAIGRLVNESWVDKEGQKRSSTRIEGQRFEALTRGEKSATATPVQAEAPKAKVDRTRAGAKAQFEPVTPAVDDLPF
jgi:single-strand DNA-binding protein